MFFSLLGHNGAGKTTIINLLTGFYEKNEGSINIMGLNLDNNLADIRKITGFCCQKDVLYEDLTVQEHLEFIAKIKGLTGQQSQQEINDILTKV